MGDNTNAHLRELFWGLSKTMPLEDLPQDWHVKFQWMVPITTGSTVKSEN